MFGVAMFSSSINTGRLAVAVAGADLL